MKFRTDNLAQHYLLLLVILFTYSVLRLYKEESRCIHLKEYPLLQNLYCVIHLLFSTIKNSKTFFHQVNCFYPIIVYNIFEVLWYFFQIRTGMWSLFHIDSTLSGSWEWQKVKTPDEIKRDFLYFPLFHSLLLLV